MPSDAADPEYVQQRAGRVQGTKRRCKVCHIHMQSDAENRLGVHVRCVYDSKVKMSQSAIPSPKYGHRRPE